MTLEFKSTKHHIAEHIAKVLIEKGLVMAIDQQQAEVVIKSMFSESILIAYDAEYLEMFLSKEQAIQVIETAQYKHDDIELVNTDLLQTISEELFGISFI